MSDRLKDGLALWRSLSAQGRKSICYVRGSGWIAKAPAKDDENSTNLWDEEFSRLAANEAQ